MNGGKENDDTEINMRGKNDGEKSEIFKFSALVN